MVFLVTGWSVVRLAAVAQRSGVPVVVRRLLALDGHRPGEIVIRRTPSFSCSCRPTPSAARLRDLCDESDVEHPACMYLPLTIVHRAGQSAALPQAPTSCRPSPTIESNRWQWESLNGGPEIQQTIPCAEARVSIFSPLPYLQGLLASSRKHE